MDRRLLFVFIMSTFVVGTAELIITGILELIADDLDIKESLVGQLITIYAISFAIGAPLLAKFTAKMERKKVLLLSLLLFTCGNLLSALSGSYAMMAAIRSITAFSAAAFIVVTLSTAARLAHPSKQGKILGLVYMGFSAANVFGVPFGTYIGISAGWRATFWFIVLSSLVCFLLIAVVMPRIEGAASPEKQSMLQLFRNTEVTSLLLITTILMTAHYIVYAYISPLMTGTGYSLETVSLILLVAGIAGTLGSGAGGTITDWIGPKRALSIACLLLILSMLFLRTSLAHLLFFTLIVFVWNFVMWSTNPTLQSALIQAKPEAGDLVLSLNMSALNIGIGLGALLGGTIVHNGYLLLSPFATAALAAISLLLLKKVNHRPAAISSPRE